MTTIKLTANEKQILNKLAELGNKQGGEDDVVFEGTKVVLPATMKNLSQAIDYLERKRAEEEEFTQFVRIFRYRPWDGALGAYNAFKKVFGLVTQQASPGFFGSTPPSMIDVATGPNEITQVPWGDMTLPIIPDAVIRFGAVNDREWGQLFRIVVTSPRKYRYHVEGLFRAVQEELDSNSIYRGKAFDGQEMPGFLDLSAVDPSKVVYAADTQRQLDANLWTLIEHTEAARTLGEPLKRAVLLEGPFGTGKSLAAILTAQRAVAHGWTFIQCRAGQDDLQTVMQTARLYQPAVVFFEDIDTLASSGEDDQVTGLLDLFDGVQAKGTEVIAVLTTNHKERIHKGMLRPGRLDAVIHIGALDTAGIMTMIRSLVPADKLGVLDSEPIGTAMRGFMPAFVREAVGRAVRYALSRGKGATDFLLETADFVDAANGLRPQLDLMEDATEGTRLPTLDASLQQAISEVLERAEVLEPDGGPKFGVIAMAQREN